MSYKKPSNSNKGGSNKVKNEENFIIPTKKKEENNEGKEVYTKYKVEMTTLYLADESKKLIEHALKFIYGNNFSVKDLSSYKEEKGLSLALNKQYRLNSGHLRVRTIENYALRSNKPRQPADITLQFAITKLKRYGFEDSHCREVLEFVHGDFGAAFELLMSRYFGVELPDPKIDTCQSAADEREQEMEAILSIYDEHFSVVISDRLWAIRLNLPYLAEHFCVKARSVISDKTTKPKTKRNAIMCKFFKEGNCKHGILCKFSHELPDKNQTSNKAQTDDSENWFVLEIRFPKGSKYPLEEAPLVSLVPESENSTMPAGVRLCMTQNLLATAKQDAEIGSPTVFNLASMLQDRPEDILAAADAPQCFPSPNDSILSVSSSPSNDIDSDGEELDTSTAVNGNDRRSNQPRSRDLDVEAIERENVLLAKNYKSQQNSEKFKKWIQSRSKLPAWAKRNEVLNTIKNNKVVMVCGETGCGKSTQVPQFLLEEWLEAGAAGLVSIVCSQPRKISAVGVASRVAEEKSDRVGGIVGYQIHLESCISRSTRLSFCTTGVLLRRLESDPSLHGVSHIVVDEVHERSEESDFLLLILKKLIATRNDLKVILMSATANARLFCDYFGGDVPIIDIPGRTFPVKTIFLEDLLESTNYVVEENSEYTRITKGKTSLEELETELELCDMRTANSMPNDRIKDECLTLQQVDLRYEEYSKQTKKNLYLLDPEKINYDLIVEAIIWTCEPSNEFPNDGSILVFLPGIGEITQLHEKLMAQSMFHPQSERFILVPLHSSLSSEEQKLLFQKTKKGIRKIILSTNIAETSVTVDDCVFVIDTGRMKENRFDENKSMETLESVWVSRANAQQRRGRAGRVRAGVAISLYTSHRFHFHFQGQPTPEIQRVSLERTIIRTKMLPLFQSHDLRSVLGSLIEPPSETAISAALSRLRLAGAVDVAGALTPLGLHCGQLPVDIRLAKLLLYGAIYCCLDSVLTMAASLAHRSPFISSFHNRAQADAKRRQFTTAHSDQITVLKAYNEWRTINERNVAEGRRFAYEKNLSLNTLSHLADVKLQFLEHLVSIGFVNAPVRVPSKTRRKSGQDLVPELIGPEWNKNGANNRLLASVLCAALFPNVVRVMTADRTFVPSAGGAVPRIPQPHELRFTTIQGDQVQIHPSSVNYGLCDYSWSPYMVFQEKVRTARVYVRDCSVVPAIALALCSGCPLEAKLHAGKLLLSLADSAILFSVESNEVAELLQAIQRELGKILEEKIRNPSLNLLSYAKGCKVITAIIDLVSRS